MPIEIRKLEEELEKASKPLDDRIYEFLLNNREKAFDIFEIGSAMSGCKDVAVFALFYLITKIIYPKENPLEPYEKAINNLKVKGMIRKWKYEGKDYFSI